MSENKCYLCGSTTSQVSWSHDDLYACLNFSECDVRRSAMREPTPPPEPRPVSVEPREDRQARRIAPLGRMAAIAMVLAAGMGHSPGAPSRPRLDPLPPPPDPEAVRKIRASSMYGRVGGAQPMPRAFYSSRLMPGEDPAEDMRSLLNRAEKFASDERHLTAAEEKRMRKAKKRRDG